MGIRCCTPIMTNIFRRHSPHRWVLWLRVRVAFLYSNPLTENMTDNKFWRIISSSWFHCWLTQFPWKMALCLGWQGFGGVSYARCHHKNTNGKCVRLCWANVFFGFCSGERYTLKLENMKCSVMWTWHSGALHHSYTDCLLSARKYSHTYTHTPHMNSEPLVGFLSWHEIEIPQRDVRGGGCFFFPTYNHLPPSHPEM